MWSMFSRKKEPGKLDLLSNLGKTDEFDQLYFYMHKKDTDDELDVRKSILAQWTYDSIRKNHKNLDEINRILETAHQINLHIEGNKPIRIPLIEGTRLGTSEINRLKTALPTQFDGLLALKKQEIAEAKDHPATPVTLEVTGGKTKSELSKIIVNIHNLLKTIQQKEMQPLTSQAPTPGSGPSE